MIAMTARKASARRKMFEFLGIKRQHQAAEKPYAPSLSSTPARIIEPAVGASVWASGSQVWKGHTGTLIAKAMANAQKAIALTVDDRHTE